MARITIREHRDTTEVAKTVLVWRKSSQWKLRQKFVPGLSGLSALDSFASQPENYAPYHFGGLALQCACRVKGRAKVPKDVLFKVKIG